MGIFDRIKGQRGVRSGQYFEPGEYDVLVNRVHWNEQAFTGKYWIVECTVIRSNNPDVKPGDIRAWLNKMPKECEELHRARERGDKQREAQLISFEDMFLGNVNRFIVAGVTSKMIEAGQDGDFPDADTVDEKLTRAVWSEDNVLAGTLMHVSVVQKPTRNNKGMFSHHNWDVPKGLEQLRANANEVLGLAA